MPDLRSRLRTITGPPRRLDRELDAPESVVAVGAGSAAVAAARVEADCGDPALWVPDNTGCRRLVPGTVGRGVPRAERQTRLPSDDDTIRTDVLVNPVPAHPRRQDEAWIDAAVPRAALLATPLRCVSPTAPSPTRAPTWNRRHLPLWFRCLRKVL